MHHTHIWIMNKMMYLLDYFFTNICSTLHLSFGLLLHQFMFHSTFISGKIVVYSDLVYSGFSRHGCLHFSIFYPLQRTGPFASNNNKARIDSVRSPSQYASSREFMLSVFFAYIIFYIQGGIILPTYLYPRLYG